MHPFWQSLGRATAVGVFFPLTAFVIDKLGDHVPTTDYVSVGWWAFMGAIAVLPLTYHRARKFVYDYS